MKNYNSSRCQASLPTSSRHKLSLCFLALLLVYPFMGWSQASDSQEALKTLQQGVRMYTLPNGLRVLMYKRGIAPVFASVIGVRVGSVDEVRGETGISHMFEHMAFKGTTTIGAKDYRREKALLKELEDIAARTDSARQFDESTKKRWDEIQKELSELSDPEAFSEEYERAGATGLNAATGTDLTQYFVSLPRQAFDIWCRMESDRLLAPVMRQFYQERDVVHEEQRSRSEDDPGGKLTESLYGTAFLMHGYRQPVIGWVDDIERLTARKLENFRARYYVPQNIVIGLVGDIDFEADKAAVERCFGRIPAGPEPVRPAVVERAQMGEKRVTVRFPSSPEFYVGYKKPQYPDPDDARITVLREILAGGRTSPLYRELVEKTKIATSVDAGEGPGLAFPNLLSFSLVPRAPHTNREVLDAFDRVIRDFKKRTVSEEELLIAKRGMSMEYLQSMNSDASLAEVLVESELLHGGWQSLLDWYGQMMTVTAADVKQVADRYLTDDTRTVAMLETAIDRR